MNNESFSDAQPHLFSPDYIVRTRAEALEELARPCGNFTLPLTLSEKMSLFVSEQLRPSDILDSASFVIAPGTPLNWQALLRYLYKNKVTHSPQFNFGPSRNDYPKVWQIRVPARWDERKTDGRETYLGGFACAPTQEITMSKAVGEMLERVSLATYKKQSLVRASYAELSKKMLVLDPETLPSYLQWQKDENPRFSYTPDSPLYWVQGECDGQAAMIPAQLVFWNYAYHDDTEPILVQPTTNGAGAHFTRDAAILSGLLETIQRDGFLIYWLNKLSPRIIDVDAMQDSRVRDLLARFRRYNIDVYFLDTTSDIRIPSVTCAIVDRRTETPVVAIGADTGFDLNEIIVHAGLEALTVIHYNAAMPDLVLPSDYRPFRDKGIAQNERRAVWRGEKMLQKFNFFVSGKKVSPETFTAEFPSVGSTTTDRLAHVRTLLTEKGAGYEIYTHEANSSILRALGYHVVQTVVPKLIPMYLTENRPTLGSERLKEVPTLLGYKPAEELHVWPHPFP